MPKLINGVPPRNIITRAAGAGQSAFWSMAYKFMESSGYKYKYGDVSPSDEKKLEKAMIDAVEAFVTQNGDSLELKESTQINKQNDDKESTVHSIKSFDAFMEGSKEEYEKFFKAALKKFNVDSPADFDSEDKKKEFFDYVDKNYKGE